MEARLYKLSLLLNVERPVIKECIRRTSLENKIDTIDVANILIEYYEEKESEEQAEELEKLQDIDEELEDYSYEEEIESKTPDYEEYEEYERKVKENKERIKRSKELGFKNIIRALEQLKIRKGTKLSKEDIRKVHLGRQALFRKIAKFVLVPEYYSKEFARAMLNIVIKYAEDDYQEYLVKREFAFALAINDEPMYVIAMTIFSRPPTQQELSIFYELSLYIKDDIIRVSNGVQKLKYIIKILMKYGNDEFRKRVATEFTKSTTVRGKVREIYDIVDEDIFA